MKNLSKALLLVTPKKDTRQYLNGARFAADGLSVEATDGHIVLHITLEDAVHPDLRGSIICNSTLKALVGSKTMLKPSDCSVSALASIGICPKFLEGRFPDTSRIADFTAYFNTFKHWGHPNGFNPQHLVSAVKVIQLMVDGAIVACTMRQHEHGSDANIYIQHGCVRVVIASHRNR